MAINVEQLRNIINEKLKPYVKKIDEEAYYAEDYLFELGKQGYFDSSNKTVEETLLDELTLVKETAKVCLTTAFCLWCHLAGLVYIRNTENTGLQQKLLKQLENGTLLGATGLSNPMKYYAGLENLHLKAERVNDGYVVNGVLPAVSNLGKNHWFGIIAQLDDKEIMFFVNTDDPTITLKEKVNFLGVNGSATYSCRFDNTFIGEEYVLSDDAGQFVEKIRPSFVIYQIPLGIGLMDASIEGIEKVKAKQNYGNEFLRIQADDIRQKRNEIEQNLTQYAKKHPLSVKDICALRLKTVYETLSAVQTNMLHNGSGGYIVGSVPSRKLREAYFFANLTPTVRHLEKMLKVLV